MMLCKGVVEACASMYGFSAEEAMEKLRIEEKKEKKEKKMEIPLPLREKDSSCCEGIVMNRGLYTQCQRKPSEDLLCVSCKKEETKNNGKLPYGKIDERLSKGNEYEDIKGRKPIAYAVVLDKLKITREMAEAFALEKGIVLSDKDFEMPEINEKKEKNEDGKRGRPKKNEKVVQVNDNEDLFAGLVQSSLSESNIEENNEEMAKQEAEKLAKKEAEKAEKLAKKEAEKAEKLAKQEADKAEKLAKQEAEKAEKLAKQEADKAEKLAKLAKKEAEKAEKLAKQEAEKAEKLAKLAKKEAEKAEKLAEKKAKSEKKEKKEEKKEEVKETEEQEEEVSVIKFEFGGKTYLKSSTNVLYDFESQDEIGVWNEMKQEIEFAEDNEEVELEEEEQEE
jgi:hypothetical protein